MHLAGMISECFSCRLFFSSIRKELERLEDVIPQQAVIWNIELTGRMSSQTRPRFVNSACKPDKAALRSPREQVTGNAAPAFLANPSVISVRSFDDPTQVGSDF